MHNMQSFNYSKWECKVSYGLNLGVCEKMSYGSYSIFTDLHD